MAATESNTGVVHLDDGDQLRVSQVTGFLMLLCQPIGDSSTSYSLDVEQARELIEALTIGVERAEAFLDERHGP